MRIHRWQAGILLTLLATFAVVGAGCQRADNKGGDAEKKQEPGKNQVAADDSATWWCKEHGIPEHICGQCDADYAEQCKKKRDWCAEHERPESQCFICHPEYEAKFVAMYEARYGKKPPAREKDPAEKEKSK